ncbi:MAG: TetR/AcrR family transcriptional regulator [Bacteroidota bacterium]
MTTRDRILDTARDLFNQKGVDNVSARTICSGLDISLGNFSYHFPDKSRIILELYQKMTEESQLALSEVSGKDGTISSYLEAHKNLFIIQNKYKFFFLNLFEILTSNAEIKELYQTSSKIEVKMAKELLSHYVSKGILKKGVREEQFDRMVNVGRILNATWLVDAELLFKGNEKKKLKHYMIICCGLLEPYLTESSLAEYTAFFNQL